MGVWQNKIWIMVRTLLDFAEQMEWLALPTRDVWWRPTVPIRVVTSTCDEGQLTHLQNKKQAASSTSRFDIILDFESQSTV